VGYQTELLDLRVKENLDFIEDLIKTCLLKTWRITTHRGSYGHTGSFYDAERWAKGNNIKYLNIK
jgi:hypothetical protein